MPPSPTNVRGRFLLELVLRVVLVAALALAGTLPVIAEGAARATAAPATAASNPPFGTTQTIDPVSGRPSALTCTEGGTCVMVDGTGQVFTRQGGSWSSQTLPAPSSAHALGLSAVSCLPGGMCVAVGDGDAAVRSPDGSWHQEAQVIDQGSDADNAVACASPTFCVTTGNFRYSVFDGSTWTKPANLTATDERTAGHIDSISCPSASFCIAVDTWGSVFRWNGSAWTLQRDVFAKTNSSVSCPDTTHCVLVAGDEIRTLQGSDWLVTRTVTDAALYHVACTGPTCVATGTDISASDSYGTNLLLDFDGAHWSDSGTAGAPGSPVAAHDLSCNAVGDCTIIDFDGYTARRQNGVWSSPTLVDHVTGHLAAVSCVSADACVAVDATGNAVHRTSAGWAPPRLIKAGVFFSHVSCAASDSCVATGSQLRGRGYQGVTARWNGTNWTTTNQDWVARSVSCPTASFCMAIIYDGRYATLGGASWTVHTSPNTISAAAECTSAAFCLAGGWRFDGTSWAWVVPHNQTVPPDDQPSCVSSTFCAVPGFANMYLWDGYSWRVGPVGSWMTGDNLDCPAVGFCIVDSGFGSVSSLVGQLHTQPVTGTDLTINDRIRGLSCPTTNRCVAVSDQAVTDISMGAPSVTQQPTDVLTVANRPVTLTVAGSGRPDPEVQWQYQVGSQWGDVTDGAGPKVIVTTRTTGHYRARLLNAGGVTYSRTATVAVAKAPVFSAQPVSHAAVYGRATTFTIAVTGTPTPNVRWQRSLNAGRSWTVAGTGSSLTLTASRAADYRAVATSAAGSVVSRAAHLTIWTVPRITRQPKNASARAKHRVTLVAVAAGSPAPTVQWEVTRDSGRHWSAVRNARSTRLQVTAKRSSKSLRFRARFVNAAGAVVTRAVRVTVR